MKKLIFLAITILSILTASVGAQTFPFPVWGVAVGHTPVPGITLPTVVQAAVNTAQVSTITFDSAPTSGNTIILFLNMFNTGTATAVASTNTTWSKLTTFTDTGGAIYDLWAGKVSGAGGTTISITHPNSSCSASALEIAMTLTPTLVSHSSTNISTAVPTHTTNLSGITTGHLVIMAAGLDDTRNILAFHPLNTYVGLFSGIVPIAASLAPGAVWPVSLYNPQNDSGHAGALLIAEIN